MGQHNREQTVWKNAQQVVCDASAKVVHRGRLVFQQRTRELFAISLQNARNFVPCAKAILEHLTPRN